MAHSSFSRSELNDLDLIKLVDWQGVGLQLGIEDYELQKIKLNYQEHDDRKREMFRAWLRTCTKPGTEHFSLTVVMFLVVQFDFLKFIVFNSQL